MLRRSAALRLTLVVALGIVLLAALALLAQYQVTKRALAERSAALLATDLSALAAVYEQRRIIGMREAIEFRLTQGDSVVLLLVDRQNQRLAGNLDAWPDGVSAKDVPLDQGSFGRVALPKARVLAAGFTLPGGFRLLVGRALAGDATLLAELRQTIALTLAGLSALALFAGFAVARVTLGRIARLNALADQVGAGDLAARIAGPIGPDEYGQLTRHFHQMLDRIQALNRATHRLSDTIAHELRTPLNRIRHKLDQIDLPPEASADLSQEIRDTIRIFDSLLDISRTEAESGQGTGLVPVDLSALAGEVFDLYEPLAEDKGITARMTLEPGLHILGDRNLVSQVMSNLLDNAIKFCGAGDEITLDLTTEGDRQRLLIRDTGPGVPEDIRDEIFDRFTRGERDRAIKGHGLGLALVQAIVTRHGGRLTLLPSPRGFHVEILWPAYRG